MPDAFGKPDPLVTDCDTCGKPVLGQVEGQYERGDQDTGYLELWSLLRCVTCNYVMLSVQVPDDDVGGGFFKWDNPHRVYPPLDRPLSTAIPPELRRYHEEARRCFHARSHIATVIMCGATLELVCKVHGIEKGALTQKIDALRNAKIIDDRLAEWATTIRLARNVSAHADMRQPPIDRQDADDSLTFIEAVLDYIYVLQARFDAMKQRRSVQVEPITVES